MTDQPTDTTAFRLRVRDIYADQADRLNAGWAHENTRDDASDGTHQAYLDIEFLLSAVDPDRIILRDESAEECADLADRLAALVTAVREAFTFMWSDPHQTEGLLQKALDDEEETRMSPEALETTKLKEEFASLEWFAKEALTEQAMECEQRLSDQAKVYEQSLLDKTKEYTSLHTLHETLRVAILAGHWNEAARMARED